MVVAAAVAAAARRSWRCAAAVAAAVAAVGRATLVDSADADPGDRLRAEGGAPVGARHVSDSRRGRRRVRQRLRRQLASPRAGRLAAGR